MTELPLASAPARPSTVQSRRGRRRSGGVTDCVTFLLVIITLIALDSSAASPNPTRLTPVAIVPGKTSALTFSGDNLEGIVDVWTSFACEVTLPKEGPAKSIEIHTPTEIGIGLGALRLVTTNGLSALQFVLVDPMPSIESTSTNHAIHYAQALPRNTAVDGTCEELRSDFFRITAKKGERLAIEVVAQRIGSPLDPLLRLLDSAGREIGFTDDSSGLGADAFLDVRCPKTGDYLIELRDARHAGSARHRYRLRFGGPLPVPLAFLADTNVTRFTQSLLRLTEVAEAEPNDSISTPQPLPLPTRLNGWFQRPADRDVFEFRAAKGERISFTGRTRSLGSPCDLLLQLQTTNGTRIAESNATGGDEGALTNRFTADGVYHLVVEELNRGGSANFHYQIAAAELHPGVAVTTETDRISGPAAASLEVEVKLERRDYDGPVTLAADGLPDSFKLENNVVPAKTNVAKLKIITPPDVALGDYFPFRIVARGSDAGRDFATRASTLPALRAAFPALRYPPMELDGLLLLSISESKSANPRPPQKKRR